MKYHLQTNTAKKKMQQKKENRIVNREENINMPQKLDLQGLFLNQVRKEHRQVTVFLMNGFQMQGQVSAFDTFVVVLMTDGKQQIIYKHAISTIVPDQPVPLEWEI